MDAQTVRIIDLTEEMKREMELDEAMTALANIGKESNPFTIPFGTLPTGLHIKGQRYKVKFDRICVPKFKNQPMPAMSMTKH